MSNQNLPFTLSAAPFPENWQGDLDEYGQQLYQNTQATVQGNFLTGLILPPGSSLPTSNQGPIAMGSTWYFWDSTTSQYLPQTVSQKSARNFCKNSSYQIAQNGTTFNTINGIQANFDMAQFRGTVNGVLTVAQVTGPPTTTDNDLVGGAIQYSCTTTLVPTPAATDLFAHEHLIEGADIKMLQGQVTSLSFSCLATLAGTYSVYLANMNRDQSFVANFTIAAGQAGQWVRVKIAGIPAFPTAGNWGAFAEGTTGLYVGIVLCTGNQWKTGLLNQWQSGFFAGSAQNINMLTVSTNTITITAIKFEGAPAPTYYQTPSFEAEYWECIRYFFTTFNYQSVTAGTCVSAVAQATNNVSWYYTFPRRLCKTPTVTPWSAAATPVSGNITNLSTGAVTALATLAGFPKGISASTAPTAVKADVFAAYIQANARLS